jgi:hypothetical protein
MQSWIDVVDSAVKIGLGAIVGGGFALYQAYRTRDEARRTDALKLRRALLQEAMKTVDAYSVALSDYWATVTNLLHVQRTGNSVDQSLRDDFERCDKALYNAFNDLHFAESRLLLLGLTSVQEALRKYAAKAEAFFTKSHPDTTTITEPELMALYTEFRDERRLLILAIGDAFRASA